jgi:hypothetical protein
MVQIFLIGLGAGAASALLSASPLSGNPISLLLALLSPLPIILAGVIWGHRLALIALVTAVLGMAVVLDSWNAIKFAAAIGGPAYILAYLAMLARPAEGGTEWYPAGRIVFWASLIGAALAIGLILSFGSDLASYQAGYRAAVEASLKHQAPGFLDRYVKSLGLKTADEFFYLTSLVMPLWVAVLSMTTNLINLWLAARIAQASGRLYRPWPHLPSISFPVASSVIFAAALAVAFFIPGFPGLISAIFVAVLTYAHSLLGLAVLHTITQGIAGRTLLLALAWASLIVGWPLLFAAMLGIADQIFNLRGRFAAKRPPLPPHQSR